MITQTTVYETQAEQDAVAGVQKLQINLSSPTDSYPEFSPTDQEMGKANDNADKEQRPSNSEQKGVRMSDLDFYNNDDLPPYMVQGKVEQKQTQYVPQQQQSLEQLTALLASNPQIVLEMLSKLQNQQVNAQNISPIGKDLYVSSQVMSSVQNIQHEVKSTSSQSSLCSQKSEDMAKYSFDPNHLIYKIDEPEKDQLNIFHEAMVNPNINKYAAKFDVCKIHPKMKKNHLCAIDHEHLCDSCIISEQHKEHQTAPLSKIALEIYNQFSQHFLQFESNLGEIQRIDAKNWKTKLRQNYLQLFDDLFVSLQKIKLEKLKEINQMFQKIDVEEVNQGLNTLQISHDLAKSYSNVLNTMFDQNQYSSIAQRQNQFNLVGTSMNHLVDDCKGLVDLASSKRRKLDYLSNQMQSLVTNLKCETEKNLLDVSEQLVICDDKKILEFSNQQESESLEQKKKKEARTGFYYFLKEQKDKVFETQPNMKYIEVIAYLQSKWTSLGEEEKLTYEMLSSDLEKHLDSQKPKASKEESDKAPAAAQDQSMNDESENPGTDEKSSHSATPPQKMLKKRRHEERLDDTEDENSPIDEIEHDRARLLKPSSSPQQQPQVKVNRTPSNLSKPTQDNQAKEGVDNQQPKRRLKKKTNSNEQQKIQIKHK